MWSASIRHMDRLAFLGLSVQLAAWVTGKGAPVGSNRRGAGLQRPLEGTPPKPRSVPVHSNSSALWSRGIPCPRRKAHGVASASRGQAGLWSLGAQELCKCRLMPRPRLMIPPRAERKQRAWRRHTHFLFLHLTDSARSAVTGAAQSTAQHRPQLLWPPCLLQGPCLPQQDRRQPDL